MDTIQQLTDNKKVAIIWYGECGEDCVDYVLTDSANEEETNKIDHIYEIADDQTKSIFYSSYVSHVHNSGVQTLTTLQCGHAYYVVLKAGGDTLEIPNMTLAHAGIGSAGKISQSCAVAPELEFLDLVANLPADLKLKLTVDIDNLVAPCAANTWKYKIITGGENEDDAYDGKEYGPYTGDNTTTVGVPVDVVSPAVDVGGVYYKVIIWGVDADGNRITEEPDQEKVVSMPWPSGVFSIVGTVDVDYLEYEGPSGESPQLSLSGQPSLIDTLHLIKPSMKTTPGADTNVTNWQYQINSDGWVDYDTITDDSSVVLAYTDKISWKLKEGLSAGNEVEDSTNYNEKMVVKCVENNGTIIFAEKDLLGEVLNRRIIIREYQDLRDFTASLNITRYNVKKWDYKLEKLSDNQQTVTETIKDFEATDIVATGSERGSETEDSTINIQSIIETHGAGYYRVTVQGYHKTNNGIVVTDVPAVEEAFLNWVTPTFSISSSGTNADTVEVFYREYEGPSLQEALVLTAQTNVHSVEFTSKTNQASWYYGLDADATTNPLPTNPQTVDATGISNVNFKLKEDQTADGTADVSYDSELEFTMKGKDTIHPLATGTTVTSTKTLLGHVKERITSIDSLVEQSNDPNANTINLRATFDLTEINRYNWMWSKDSLDVTGAGTGPMASYNSNNLTEDFLVDLNTDNTGVYKFELIGKHTDAGNTDVNETAWVQGQIAPKVEETITVAFPTPSLEATSSVSDSFQEGNGPSASGQNVSVTKYHWLDHSSVKFSADGVSIWEYKTSGGDWTPLSNAYVSVAPTDITKFRVKADTPEGTTAETLTWTATGLNSAIVTDTTTLSATITEPVALPKVAWIGFSGGNAGGVKQYSDWYELEAVETAKVVLDNPWPPAATGGQGGAIGVNIDIDFTPSNPFQGDTPTHNIFNNTPFTSDTLAPYGSTPSTGHPFHGKTIKSDDNGTTLYIEVEMDHTQLVIASSDASTYASSLSSFCTQNSVTELSYIVITANPTRPDNDAVSKPWIAQAFDSDSFRMKCGGTWNFDDSDAEQYNLKIDGKGGSSANTTFRYSPSSPSGHASGPWSGIGMQFFSATALTPPSSGDSVGSIPMSDIKLELGTNNSGVYAKLSNGNPEGSICS